MSKFTIRSHDLVVVLDGRKALFFENVGNAIRLDLAALEVRERQDPPNRELQSDRPGRVHQSAASFRSAIEVTDFHEEAERAFVEEIAQRLDALAVHNRASRFIVIAPPRALGALRKGYTPNIRAGLQAEIGQDWVNLPVDEIEKRLDALT